jgi:large subunit ribosomal protein L25
MINASEKIVFHVSSRPGGGSGKSSQLRREGRLPGNIYGLGKESLMVDADYQGLRKLYLSQGDTGLVYLQVDDDKKQVPVLIEEVQTARVGGDLLHVAFKRVSLNVKIQADVSVTTVGETKIDEAVVSLIKDTVLVEALPADLPDNFELDISTLTEVGQSISLADLSFDKSKVTLILGEDEKPEDVVLVNVQAVKEEVEVVEEVTDENSETEEGGEATVDGGDKTQEDAGSDKEDSSEKKDSSEA